MRAIFINSYEHTIDEIEFTGGLGAFYAKIGCTTVEVYPLGDEQHHDIWFDEEGSFKKGIPRVSVGQYEYLGNCIILGGADEEGETTAARLDIKSLLSNIKFHSPVATV